jgi:hypothetical protein
MSIGFRNGTLAEDSQLVIERLRRGGTKGPRFVAGRGSQSRPRVLSALTQRVLHAGNYGESFNHVPPLVMHSIRRAPLWRRSLAFCGRTGIPFSPVPARHVRHFDVSSRQQPRTETARRFGHAAIRAISARASREARIVRVSGIIRIRIRGSNPQTLKLITPEWNSATSASKTRFGGC